MLRSVMAVVCGYLVFAISAVALFAVTGRDPHAPASVGFTILSALYGALFGALAGFVAASIAATLRLKHAMAVGYIIALGAIVSLIARPGEGSLWTQLETILFFAPMTALGGILRRRLG